MRAGKRGAVALVGATCLVGTYLATPIAAHAATTAPVPFSQAKFNGYGSGTEVATTAATIGATSLAALGQAVSSAATHSLTGLTTAQTSVPGNVINPAEPSSVKAYASGTGAALGVGATPAEEKPLLGGTATSIAPPISAASHSDLTNANLGPLGTLGTLIGQAETVYDPEGQTCPLGEPIAYGSGNAANAQVLTTAGIPGLGTLLGASPVVNTAGSGTSTASSVSETYLSSNGDGTFGLTSQVNETIAPITISLGTLLDLQITLAGATPNSPVTLVATSSGEASKPSTVTLAADDTINIAYSISGSAYTSLPGFPDRLSTNTSTINLGTSGLNTTLDAALGLLTGSQLGTLLSPLLGPNSVLVKALEALGNTAGPLVQQLLAGLNTNLSLGSLTVDSTPFAIGGQPGSAATQSPDGTSASGQTDLLHLHVGITGMLLGATIPPVLGNVVDLHVGHLEAVSNLAAPILCTIPILKTATPDSIRAGGDFVYNIYVPNPAKLNLLGCSLADISVVDTISDHTGQPTFRVLSVNENGKIDQTSTTNATMSWTGLSYTLGQAPIDLQITVTVPTASPAGVFLDNVTAETTLTGCEGNGSATNGAKVPGTFTLIGPTVTAAPAVPLAAEASTPQALPRTGGEGGLWQPGLGLGLLALAGGAVTLLRRSRRSRQS